MDKCNNCKINYPDGYCAPVLSTFGGSKALCGICALDYSNEALGIKGTDQARKRFQGEIAEQMRQDALAFRKKNNL